MVLTCIRKCDVCVFIFLCTVFESVPIVEVLRLLSFKCLLGDVTRPWISVMRRNKFTATKPLRHFRYGCMENAERKVLSFAVCCWTTMRQEAEENRDVVHVGWILRCQQNMWSCTKWNSSEKFFIICRELNCKLKLQVENFECGGRTVLSNEGELCVRRKWIRKKEKE